MLIGLNYHQVELRCRQHVIGDLDKYYRALDWAIMQYHRYVHFNKMAQLIMTKL